MDQCRDIVEGQGLIESHERSMLSSANRSKNKIYEYCRANDWDWFVTLTFDREKFDTTNYDLASAKVSQWIKNMKRDYAPNLRYVAVPELHNSIKSTVKCGSCGNDFLNKYRYCPKCNSDFKKYSYHFHALMSDVGKLSIEKSEHVDKMKRRIYNFGNYKLGWSTGTKVRNSKKASNYISKYITKELCMSTPNKKRYWNSNNLKKPDITKMLLDEDEIKKLLESVKNQVVHKTSVEIDREDYQQTVEYYELSIT